MTGGAIFNRIHIGAIACGGLCVLFVVIALCAAGSKCATFDEPLHLTAAWIQSQEGDFRCNPEDPPLWKYYVAAGAQPHGLKIDRSSPDWLKMLSDTHAQWRFSIAALYQTPGTDADALIASGRRRMVVFGAMLGGLIAWWAWKLGGAGAAVVATAFYCLDPNFLGHAPLIKNDLLISLLFLGLMASLWRLGERVTIGRLIATALIAVAMAACKFSGLLAVPLLLVTLVSRALLPDPWPVLGWTAASRFRRILAAGGIAIGSLLTTYLCIWAVYGFRFSAAANGQPMDLHAVIEDCAQGEIVQSHQPLLELAESQYDQWRREWHPGVTVRLSQWALAHRLAPEAYIAGFLYTYATTLTRHEFLLGRRSISGWWYYFPLAVAFKTPLATLAAIGVAIGFGISRGMGRYLRGNKWPLLVLIIGPAIYTLVAMRSHLDIGLRHIFPVYPFLFIFLGVMAASARRSRPRATAAICGILLAGLAVETFSAYPNFIAFFNAAAGGSRGGLNLLSDSNLDWGQDVPLLADWQRRNPDRAVVYIYFGSVDPRYYGIGYCESALVDSVTGQSPPAGKRTIVAVGATMLQGTSAIPQQQPMLAALRGMQPIEVLGGTIYLYDLP